MADRIGIDVSESSRRTCAFNGCGRPFKGHGLCAAHLHQQGRGVSLTPITHRTPTGTDRRCSFNGCHRPHKGHGLCIGHLQQQRRGDPLHPLIRKRRPTRNRECGFVGCGDKHYARGWCNGHYNQLRRGDELSPLRGPRDACCTFEGCEKPHHARGLCKGHVQQQERGYELRPLFTRLCVECGAAFTTRLGYRCPACATYPAELRRRRVQEARVGWTAEDVAQRRKYVSLITSDPCSYCGASGPNEADHIVPLHGPGTDGWDNLTAACRSCNGSKAARSLLAFMLERVG